ncbi:tetratricopeptide repeat protein [bacterium]|nr:tetratricopeptide repeat protein [bacterium]MBP9808628.1 tetratricopeptide repeat protein [bacterium]
MKLSTLLSICLLCALAPGHSNPALSSPTTSAPGAAMKEIEHGRKLALTKQWQEASKYFQKAIALNPRQPEAYYEDGIAQMELGHYKEALSACEQALCIESTYIPPYLTMGDIYAKLHQYSKAIDNYSIYISGYPDLPQTYLSRAKAYEALGKTALAKRDQSLARKAEKQIDLQVETMFNQYGIAKEKQAALKARYKNDPFNKQLTMQQIHIEGRTCFLKKNPFSRRDYLYRARLYRDTAQTEKAIADFTKVIEIPPNKGGHVDWNLDQTLFDRANLYFAIRDYARAIADYSKIIELDDDSEDAYKKRGDCQFALGQYKKALDDYNLALKHEVDPTAESYRARANTYEKLGKPELAAKDRKSALEAQKKR